ncbi:hypothetical protein [Corynebacterium sp. NML130628]|uniref:hypothetical protein n=1 Tax=Corynebacterium sp. NML130628 TaxID=1906333 RepID=UPI0015A5DED8|nr:hypothetical protein [Corynebacterium sp. NML130628]
MNYNLSFYVLPPTGWAFPKPSSASARYSVPTVVVALKEINESADELGPTAQELMNLR